MVNALRGGVSVGPDFVPDFALHQPAALALGEHRPVHLSEGGAGVVANADELPEGVREVGETVDAESERVDGLGTFRGSGVDVRVRHAGSIARGVEYVEPK